MPTNIFFYLVQTNFIDLIIVVFLYIFLLSNTTISKKMNRVFLITAVIINILIFADSTDFYLEQGTKVHSLRYFTSATGYTFRPLPIIMLATILERDKKTKNYIMFIPVIINGLLAYTSIFTKWMFYFDENNRFHRGPVGAFPFIISGLYLIYLLRVSVEKYRLGYIKEGFVMIFIVVMSAMASALETIFHFKFIINGVGAIATVFYYLFLHTQTYKRDGLTKVFNRHTFYIDCEEKKGNPMFVISVDLNNLKQINDTKGHLEGDRAIITVAQKLSEAFAKAGNVYRIGGDEFVILCQNPSEETVISKMKWVDGELEDSKYHIAWGCARYLPSMDFDEVLSESDANMYKDKQRKKENCINAYGPSKLEK